MCFFVPIGKDKIVLFEQTLTSLSIKFFLRVFGICSRTSMAQTTSKEFFLKGRLSFLMITSPLVKLATTILEALQNCDK